MRLSFFILIWSLAATVTQVPGAVWAQTTKPNILVIFGDDIGQTNVSAYSATFTIDQAMEKLNSSLGSN